VGNALRGGPVALALVVAACGAASTASHEAPTTPMSAAVPGHRILIQQGHDFAIFNPRNSRTVSTDVAVPQESAVAATAGWVTLGLVTHHGHGERIYSQPFHEGRRRVLVANTEGGAPLAAGHGYMYWAGRHAIGRVRIAGGRVIRRFRPVPADSGSVPRFSAEGLSISGDYLYFSQCMRNRIGRVRLAGPSGHHAVRWMVHTDSCPEQLAVGDGHIYWSGIAGGPHDGESIGRAKLDGRAVQAGWIFMGLHMHIGDPIVYGHRLYWQGWNLRHPAVMHLYETRATASRAHPNKVRTIGTSDDITPINP
jgi:hypothetical protein